MTLQFTVANMACSACSDTITTAIKAIDTTAQVVADSKTKLVQVQTQASEASIKAAVTNAGYTVS